MEQLTGCGEAGDAVRGVLCADAHVGYSQPIGGAVAYADSISPSGGGYDIACGNKAARTSIRVEELRPDIARVMDQVVEPISLGGGRQNNQPVDRPARHAVRHARGA